MRFLLRKERLEIKTETLKLRWNCTLKANAKPPVDSRDWAFLSQRADLSIAMRHPICCSSAAPQGRQDRRDQTHDAVSLLQLSRKAQIKFCWIQARLLVFFKANNSDCLVSLWQNQVFQVQLKELPTKTPSQWFCMAGFFQKSLKPLWSNNLSRLLSHCLLLSL